MADRELVLRHVRILPDAAPLPFLPLVHQPVVVAFVHDVAFRGIHGRGARAGIELAPERDLLLRDPGGLDIRLVARRLELLPRHRGEDLLVPEAELALVDANVAVARLVAEGLVVLGGTAVAGELGPVELQHLRREVLAEEPADTPQHGHRIAHQLLVAQVHPLVGGELPAPGHDRVLAQRPALGGAEDVGRTERGIEVVGGGVAAVARDEDELGVREVLDDLLHEEEVVRRLLAPAGPAADAARVALVHGAVDAGEAALPELGEDLVDDGPGVHFHAPERRLQPEHHLLGERAEISVPGELAVRVEIGPEPGVVPDDFRHRDAWMAAEHGHHQGRAGALGSDHDDGPLLQRDGHSLPPGQGCLMSRSPSQARKSMNAWRGVSLKPTGMPIFLRTSFPLSVASRPMIAARSRSTCAAESLGEAIMGMLIWSRLLAITRPPFFSLLRPTPEVELTTPTSKNPFSSDQPIAAWSRIARTDSLPMSILLSRSIAFAARHMFEYWSGVRMVLPFTSAIVLIGEFFTTMKSV